MSLQPFIWAVEKAPDVPSHCLPVLLGLANHASRTGRNAYPSVELLGYYARKSERAVHNDLRELEKRGLIRRGDQRAAYDIPERYRPTVWDLCMDAKPRPDYVPKRLRDAPPRHDEEWAAAEAAAPRDGGSERPDGDAPRPAVDCSPQPCSPVPPGLQPTADEPPPKPSGYLEGVRNVSRGEDQQPPNPQPAVLPSPSSAAPSGGGDPEPLRTCGAGHPLAQACGACRGARQAHEEWQGRQLAGRRSADDAERRVRAAEKRLAADAVAGCRSCDAEGRTAVVVPTERVVAGVREVSDRSVRLVCMHDDRRNQRAAKERVELLGRFGSGRVAS